MVTLAGLHVYPVKSCRGIALDAARLTEAGFEHDREWMVVTPHGRFLTQREAPRLACVDVVLDAGGLHLSADGAGPITVPLRSEGDRVDVTVWRDRCSAFDAGGEAAEWFSALLGRAVRLVRFDPAHRRPSDREWTGDVEALNRFTDGFPLLVISRASLDDLNARLPEPLPMERFRPNLVVEGLDPYGEDRVLEFVTEGVRLRAVKPCTRCIITTIDQRTGQARGEEPIRTLETYRWDPALRGVAFGQNVAVAEGVGRTLRRGHVLGVQFR